MCKDSCLSGNKVSISLFSGYHASDSASWIFHITFITRDDMYMNMEDALAGDFAYIYSNIVSV